MPTSGWEHPREALARAPPRPHRGLGSPPAPLLRNQVTASFPHLPLSRGHRQPSPPLPVPKARPPCSGERVLRDHRLWDTVPRVRHRSPQAGTDPGDVPLPPWPQNHHIMAREGNDTGISQQARHKADSPGHRLPQGHIPPPCPAEEPPVPACTGTPGQPQCGRQLLPAPGNFKMLIIILTPWLKPASPRSFPAPGRFPEQLYLQQRGPAEIPAAVGTDQSCDERRRVSPPRAEGWGPSLRPSQMDGYHHRLFPQQPNLRLEIQRC